MAILRYDEQTPLAGNLLGTDMLCFSRAPYGAGAPFVHAELTDVFNYVNTLLSPLFFAGTWNALTNTPALVSGSGVNGAVYVVNTAGTTDLDGHNNWKVGDWAVFDENIMQWTQVANEVISTVNIYNSDGLLTGNRTVTLGANTLFFTGAAGSTFQVSAPQVTVNGAQATVSSSNITFDAAQFVGAGTHWLTTDNAGNIVPVASPVNIYNADGVLTGARTLDTNAFNLAMNGTGNINLDVPNLYLTQTSGNSTTVGSATFDGIANQQSQLLKGKFNVVVDDDTGVSGTTLIRFSQSYPNIFAMGKAEGTEAAPLIVTSNTLVSVMAHAVYDGTTFSGKPNFNPIIQELFFAADGQAAGNSPGAYIFGVTLSGDGSAPIPFMTFNLSSKGEAAFGPNTSASGLNSVVVGNNISSSVDNEVLIGNTVGLTTISSPIVNIDAPQIGLVSAPFSGGGTQYLTVDNSGNLIPDGGAGGINIYNADGNLTADRILTLDGHNLTITGGGSESVYIYAASTQIGANNGQFLYLTARVFLPVSPFIGGGNQVLGCDGSGQIITIVPRTLYTADDSLIANRVVTLIGHTLRFTGNSSSGFTVDSGTIDLGLTSATTLQLRATTFINQSGFIGGGNQYIGVSNTGQLQTMAAPSDTNIYNSDGTLTATRTLSLGTSDLILGSALTSLVRLNTSGFLQITSASSMSIGTQALTLAGATSLVFSSDAITIGGSGSALSTFLGGARFASAPFTGAGTQYLTVNNTGDIVPVSSPAAVNIYNTNGSLTGNRTVTLGSNTLTFSGVGGVSIGSGSTANGTGAFSQGNTNVSAGINSVCLGGLLNNNYGIDSGILVSNGCTITPGSGTAGYGAMLAAYNCIGFDNQTVTIAAVNGVNNGQRSIIFGGQTNKINAPNSLAASDNFIFGGNTNTMTGAVSNSIIAQSDSCIIGDNTNALANAWVFNSASCSLLPNAAIGNSNMVDLNGTNNTLKSHYAFLINCKNNNFTSNTFGLGGRYFLANVVNYSVPAGNYVAALNAQTGTLDGNYSTQLSCNNTTFTSNATYATVVSGQNHTNGGTSSTILNGNTNVIDNVQNSAAIGSNCTVNHNECLLINDGAAALTSANDRTIVIQAANGLALGRGTNNPNRDVVIGKKAGFYSVDIGIDFDTASLEAVQYNIDTSGNNVTGTLADADKVGGNFFIFNKTDPGNQVIILPASGTINGSSSVSVSGVGPYIVVCNGTNWFVR